jgi:hypothetical protein
VGYFSSLRNIQLAREKMGRLFTVLVFRIRWISLLIHTSASGLPQPIRLKNVIAPVLDLAVSTNIILTPS